MSAHWPNHHHHHLLQEQCRSALRLTGQHKTCCARPYASFTRAQDCSIIAKPDVTQGSYIIMSSNHTSLPNFNVAPMPTTLPSSTVQLYQDCTDLQSHTRSAIVAEVIFRHRFCCHGECTCAPAIVLTQEAAGFHAHFLPSSLEPQWTTSLPTCYTTELENFLQENWKQTLIFYTIFFNNFLPFSSYFILERCTGGGGSNLSTSGLVQTAWEWGSDTAQVPISGPAFYSLPAPRNACYLPSPAPENLPPASSLSFPCHSRAASLLISADTYSPILGTCSGVGKPEYFHAQLQSGVKVLYGILRQSLAGTRALSQLKEHLGLCP